MPRLRPVVAGRVQPDCERDEPEQRDEDGGERVESQRDRADEVAGAEGAAAPAPWTATSAAAHARGRAAERGRPPREQRGTLARRQAERRRGEPEAAAATSSGSRGDHATASSRRSKRIACTFSSSRPTATSSPCSSASGLGGQPGT